MATKSELNSTKTELNSTKKELNSTKTELNSTKIELNSTKKEPTSDETEYEWRKKRETITSWLEFMPVLAICTVSAVFFMLTLKELISERETMKMAGLTLRLALWVSCLNPNFS